MSYNPTLTNLAHISSKLYKDIYPIVRRARNIDDFLNNKFIKEKVKKANINHNEEQNRLESSGAKIIDFFSPIYPNELKEIDLFPLAFYALGNINLLKKPKVAIVGSRNPTFNGAKIASDLAKFLCSHGVVVVSGFAAGIDSYAHKESTDNTIAVFGTGIDNIYPSENHDLYNLIVKGGLIVSEYPHGSMPMKYNFPKRNRIISGLADIVVVIEAKINSGSLITANFAIEHNKELFVVPGHPYDYRVAGSNKLIKDGANILIDFNEILDVLNIKYNVAGKKEKIRDDDSRAEDKDYNDIELKVISLLSDIPITANQIINKLDIEIKSLNVILSKLELDDKIMIDINGNINLKYNN